MVFQLKKRDKDYLFYKKSKNKIKSKKFNYIKVELFFIKDIKKNISYKVELSYNTQICFIFYILVLKSVN